MTWPLLRRDDKSPPKIFYSAVNLRDHLSHHHNTFQDNPFFFFGQLNICRLFQNCFRRGPPPEEDSLEETIVVSYQAEETGGGEPVAKMDNGQDDSQDPKKNHNHHRPGARIRVSGPPAPPDTSRGQPTHLHQHHHHQQHQSQQTSGPRGGTGGPQAGSSGGGGGGGGFAMGNQGIRQHVETSTKTGVFHLSKAKLNEFPPELAKIVNNLRSIDLSENKISLIPLNISAFVNLKHLNMAFNQIEVIPDQIGQLTKLETLSLQNNRIKGVPSTVAHLQKLRDVNLSNNQLTTFPTVFSSLKFLTVLDLARNRIPEVPPGVGDLQVVELILNQNQIRQVSSELARCPNLKTLRLQENTLEIGGIPKEILKDSLVSLLSVEGNLFDVKQLSDVEGWEEYMERYTSTKKKLM